MNIFKTGEEVFKKALIFSRCRPLFAQLGSLLQREHTHIKHPQLKPASSWNLVNVVGQGVSTVRYYSQGDHLGVPIGESLDVQDPPDPQELPVHPRNKKLDAKNLFIQKLEECSSPSDVLDLISNKTLTQRRISSSLSRIWHTIKKLSDDQRRYELKLMFEHPGFEELCHDLIVMAPGMQTQDMAFSLLALVRLDVPQRSRVVQTFLRVIQENLNRFDERSLAILAGALEKMEQLPNVEALKEGLRLRLEKNMPLIQNILSLQSIMRVVGKGSSTELKRKIEMKALSMADSFTLPNAQYMLASMAAMGLYSRQLLEICCQKIEENVQGVPFSKLLMVLKACQDLHYRNHALLSTMAEYLTTSCSMWSNKQIILLLLAFEKMNFHPVNLMGAFAERIIQNPDALMLQDILSVLKVYSHLNHDLGDHRQQFLVGLAHAMEAYLDRLYPGNLLRAVFYFCMLGHFPALALERLFQRDTLDQLFNPGADKQPIKGLEQNLHLLDLCLRLDQSALPRPEFLPSLLGDFSPPPHLPPPPGLLSTLQSLKGVGAIEEGVVVEKIYHIGKEVFNYITLS
ncbi:hypothetical protein ACEWY4_016335 [Coilia grayii]|uniref:FAST kinase leucine-rich domain-containing protein n=1 Tax=Coilia grayii TaxID=363190 RepID=A0ABD1JK86_9TELE